MSGVKLERVKTTCDFGITVNHKLKFTEHIHVVLNNANRALGFLIRSCKNFKNKETLKALYCTLVRSKFEYALIICSPKLAKHVIALEKCQKRFLKFIAWKEDGKYPQRGSSYSELNKRFNMWSSEHRRLLSGLLFILKLARVMIDSPYLLSVLQIHV